MYEEEIHFGKLLLKRSEGSRRFGTSATLDRCVYNVIPWLGQMYVQYDSVTTTYAYATLNRCYDIY